MLNLGFFYLSSIMNIDRVQKIFFIRVGAESLAVAQNNYAVLWFKGKELNMVFGLQLSFARMGSTVNFWVMENIYQWVAQTVTGTHILGYALLIGQCHALVLLPRLTNFETFCSCLHLPSFHGLFAGHRTHGQKGGTVD